MKLVAVTILVIVCFNRLISQTQINGHVYNKKGQPLSGVSLINRGTFHATTTDSLGRFVLDNPNPSDTFRLMVSLIGYETIEKQIPPSSFGEVILIKLLEKVTVLKDVVISAGHFEASEGKKTTILKPFDIATTPTAYPDAFKAIEQLPGTTKVGESEGLFVRGGDAKETKAVIDGLIVQDPFYSNIPGVAQKGRFSPLMFKGTSFSTGGYSAQYGQALSSVLLLNTQDVAQASSTSIILSTPGIAGNITQKWKNTSLAFNANYYNLEPSFAINKQNFTYDDAPESIGSNIMFRHKGQRNSLFKFYASYQASNVALQLPFALVDSQFVKYRLDNNNLYINSTYKVHIGNWQLLSGACFSHNRDKPAYDTLKTIKEDSRSQVRVLLTRSLYKRAKIFVGTEWQFVQYKRKIKERKYDLDDLLLGNFAEIEFYVGNKIATRVGLRREVSYTLERSNLVPRISLAYIINPHSQFSIAYGDFYQLPAESYLFTNRHLQFEKATHYIFNYQYVKNNRTFRIEGYYKDYDQLVKEPQGIPFEAFNHNRIPPPYSENKGFGYASGIDIFWYDKSSIKGLDYWLSYSYLDTKRFYQNYPGEAMPIYAANHNVSIVAKYQIPKTTLNIGFTYNYTSGRPYFDPNHAFLTDRTPPVHNLIFSSNYSWFYGTNLFAVFVYVDNILGIKNIYNYFFSLDGTHRYTITPPAYRSIYAGINITLAKSRTMMGINF